MSGWLVDSPYEVKEEEKLITVEVCRAQETNEMATADCSTTCVHPVLTGRGKTGRRGKTFPPATQKD